MWHVLTCYLFPSLSWWYCVFQMDDMNPFRSIKLRIELKNCAMASVRIELTMYCFHYSWIVKFRVTLKIAKTWNPSESPEPHGLLFVKLTMLVKCSNMPSATISGLFLLGCLLVSSHGSCALCTRPELEAQPTIFILHAPDSKLKVAIRFCNSYPKFTIRCLYRVCAHPVVKVTTQFVRCTTEIKS